MGLGVLEARGALKASRICVGGLGGLSLAEGLTGLCEAELIWGFSPQRGCGCVRERRQKLGLGVLQGALKSRALCAHLQPSAWCGG